MGEETEKLVSGQRRVLIFGMLGLFASLGLGRFSLGVMLPAMGEGLQLSYSQMGVISTVNFIGYLLAVLACGRLAGRFGNKQLISAALLLVGGSMALVGLAANYLLVLLLYFLTGVGSALSNVPVMALITGWFAPGRRGWASGIVVMGNGLGILVAGKTIPYLNSLPLGWRAGWLVLGCLAALLGLLCYLFLVNAPGGGAWRGAGKHRTGSAQKDWRATLKLAGAIYFLFGFTYVIYVTFIVTSLVEDRGMTEMAAASLWSLGGLVSLSSGPIFGTFSDRCGRRAGLMVAFVMFSLAFLLAGWGEGEVSAWASVLCFSLVVWSVPPVIAALVGDTAGPERAAAVFGTVTFVFGLGQVAGPALAGWLAEQQSSFTPAFTMAALCTGLAIVLAGRLPKGRAGQGDVDARDVS